MFPTSQQYDFLNERINQSIQAGSDHFAAAATLDNKISNQIGVITLAFTIVSIVLGVLGVILAYYINNSLKKIAAIKTGVEETSDYIESRNEELFSRLQRSLIKANLNRLKRVPEDIANLLSSLYAADLLEEDYVDLKEAALLSTDRDDSYLREYVSVLLQHFPLLSLRDNDLRDLFVSNVDGRQFDAMYAIDIDRFFNQLVRFIQIERDNQIRLDTTTKLLEELKRSRHGYRIPDLQAKAVAKSIELEDQINESILTENKLSFRTWLNSSTENT